MTNTQIKNIDGIRSFANNIGKLSIGRSTNFKSCYGTRYGKVTCETVGRRPRLFMVSGSEVIPNGSGYTYKTLMRNLFDQVVL